MAKVLVIEDSVFARERIKAQLIKEGYEILEAATAYGAIAKYKQDKPDVVLLSILIKRTPDDFILEEILKLDPQAKIIMLTDIGVKDKIANCLNKGACDCLVSPIESKQLKEAINKALGSKGRG